jgi:hypothetical protein
VVIGDWSKSKIFDDDHMVEMVDAWWKRKSKTTTTLTTWSTAVREFPCLRAAGGDWSKDFTIDYMVDCRPRVFLSEGRGW